MTSPSSRLIRAISVSIWARNSSASAGVNGPPSTLRNSASASAARQVGGRAVGWPWSVEVAPISRSRRGACGARRDSPARRGTSSPVSSAKRSRLSAEVLVLGIDHRVGPIGGDHPALPAAGARWPCGARSVSSGLSVVASTSMPKRSNSARGRKARRRQRLGDAVEIEVGGLGASSRTSMPEHLGEDLVEPHARGRAAEQVVVRGEQPPGLARIGRAGPVARRHAERLQRHALANRACGTGSGRARAAARSALANGALLANQAGSVWPCGLTIGRSATLA